MEPTTIDEERLPDFLATIPRPDAEIVVMPFPRRKPEARPRPPSCIQSALNRSRCRRSLFLSACKTASHYPRLCGWNRWLACRPFLRSRLRLPFRAASAARFAELLNQGHHAGDSAHLGFGDLPQSLEFRRDGAA